MAPPPDLESKVAHVAPASADRQSFPMFAAATNITPSELPAMADQAATGAVEDAQVTPASVDVHIRAPCTTAAILRPSELHVIACQFFAPATSVQVAPKSDEAQRSMIADPTRGCDPAERIRRIAHHSVCPAEPATQTPICRGARCRGADTDGSNPATSVHFSG